MIFGSGLQQIKTNYYLKKDKQKIQYMVKNNVNMRVIRGTGEHDEKKKKIARPHAAY